MNMKRTLQRCAILAWLSSGLVWAQSTEQQPADANQNTAAKGTSAVQKTDQEAQEQTDQPMSLADAARLARINKGNSAKPVKTYDDDNFVRSTPIRKKNVSDAPESASNGNTPTETQGKIVLLDFWASWCGPCRMALPKVKQLQAIYSSPDFMVVSVSEDDDEAAWRAFVSNHQMTWTQKFDGDSSMMRQYQVEGLPTYILLGRDGKEIQRYVGEDPGQSIVERIGPELKRALETKEAPSN